MPCLSAHSKLMDWMPLLRLHYGTVRNRFWVEVLQEKQMSERFIIGVELREKARLFKSTAQTRRESYIPQKVEPPSVH